MNYRTNGGLVKPEWLQTTCKTAEGRRENLSAEARLESQKTIQPMQRVEFDDWVVDVTALMSEEGFPEHLGGRKKRKLRFDKKRALRTVTAVICRKTRCIVGLVA